MGAERWPELEARITGDWDTTDSSLAFADPRESYAVIDSGMLFVPYDLVGIVRCKTCGDQYANRAFLQAHEARDHSHAAASAGPARANRFGEVLPPDGVPAPVSADKVRPLRPESESERPMRPKPDTTVSRVQPRRGARRTRYGNSK